jgi:hypothetical protein
VQSRKPTDRQLGRIVAWSGRGGRIRCGDYCYLLFGHQDIIPADLKEMRVGRIVSFEGVVAGGQQRAVCVEVVE